jgi:hypothetical protein
MRILLLGDFSSFHKNLRDGLRVLGHDAYVASAGDSWKSIDKDIDLNWTGRGTKKMVWRYKQAIMTRKRLMNYDVLQLMNPIVFKMATRLNNIMVKSLISKSNKSFLVAAGTDSMYWNEAKTKLRYTPHYDYQAIDQNNLVWSKKYVTKYNKSLANKVNSVIPILYDYSVGYRDKYKLTNPIAIPIDLEEVKYSENIVVGKKLRVFHGVSRAGFKGTRFIKEAFSMLEKSYPNDIECVIADRLPYPEYIKLLTQANIVVDQVNTYGWGVNAAIALSLGKVVLSGAEPEALEYFNLTESPVINVKPDVDQIIFSLENILEKRRQISEMGHRSREFAEMFHDHISIAEQYVKTWSSN